MKAKLIISIMVFISLEYALINAATVYVPDDYPTIQDAIISAVKGDSIVVRPGTYVENINFLGKAILVRSELGPLSTIIDGSKPSDPDYGCVIAFRNNENERSVVEGFTLTNGTGYNRCGVKVGGGIYCEIASPTIRNNIITTSSVHNGGGICALFSSAVIDNNIITNNYADRGGGIYSGFSSLVIERNTINGNNAIYGGGIDIIHSEPIITIIKNNTIAANNASSGAGINCYGNTLILSENNIHGNCASFGGGLFLMESSANVEKNNIYENTAIYGGGIDADASFNKTIIINNNFIYRNSAVYGGGINSSNYKGTLSVINNTVFENQATYYGGGIKSFGSIFITNTILWNNSAPNGPEMNPGLYAEYSDVKGGWPGPGNIDSDPLFVDEGFDDFHLTYDSPCRNAGTNTAQYFPLEDFEGDPRIVEGTADMGADEFYYHLYSIGDTIPGSLIDLKVIGPPGASPVRLLASQGTREPPLQTPYGDLYLAFPIRPFDIGTIPSNGVLVSSRTVPSWWMSEEEHPFQALVGPLSPGSRLTNLLVLEVE